MSSSSLRNFYTKTNTQPYLLSLLSIVLKLSFQASLTYTLEYTPTLALSELNGEVEVFASELERWLLPSDSYDSGASYDNSAYDSANSNQQSSSIFTTDQFAKDPAIQQQSKITYIIIGATCGAFILICLLSIGTIAYIRRRKDKR